MIREDPPCRGLGSPRNHWPWMGRPHCRDCWNCSRKCRNSLGWCRKQKVQKSKAVNMKSSWKSFKLSFLIILFGSKTYKINLELCISGPQAWLIQRPVLGRSLVGISGIRVEIQLAGFHLGQRQRSPSRRRSLWSWIMRSANIGSSRMFMLIPLGFLQTLDEGKVKWTTWGRSSSDFRLGPYLAGKTSCFCRCQWVVNWCHGYSPERKQN